MSGLFLSSDVLDGGLSAFALANKIAICSTEPASYTAATSAASLGYSTYAVGSVAASSQIGSAFDGRQITAINVSTGLVTASGTPAVWAILDDANSRLLAYGPMLNATAVSSGSTFALGAISIDMPGAPYSFPLVSSTGGGASVDLNFAANRYYGSTLSSTAPRANFIAHFDGVDGSTVFTDATGLHTITATGATPPQIDTAQSKFGGASAFFNNSAGSLLLDGRGDFSFGLGDFTIDMWVRLAANNTQYHLFEFDTGGASPLLYVQNDNHIKVWSSATSDIIAGTTALAANTWYHIAWVRFNGNMKIFLNGAQEGNTYSTPINITNTANNPALGGGTGLLNGWMEEVRVLPYAAWTGPFTPPTAAYNDDPAIDAYTYLSCTRASVGYAKTLEGTLRYFGENQLRITNAGLLIEPARTNYVGHTGMYTSTEWTPLRISVSSGVLAPDGSNTAVTCTPLSSDVDYKTFTSVSMEFGNNTTPRCYSIYGKSTGPYLTKTAHYDGSTLAAPSFWIDFAAGTISLSTESSHDWTNVFYGIKPMADDWWEAYYGGTPSTANNTYSDVRFQFASSAKVLQWFPDGVSNIKMWGPQAELLATAGVKSSYIPTSGVAATRAADYVKAVGTLDSILTAAEETFLFSLNPVPALGFYLYYNDGAYIRSEGNSQQFFSWGGGLVSTLGSGSWLATGGTGAWARSAAGQSLCANGGTVASDTATFTISTGTAVIGAYQTLGSVVDTYFRRISAWNSRLSDTAIQTLTASS